MGDIVEGATTKKPLFVSRYLDALYEVKFKLALKRIEGKVTIAKKEFKQIIEEETAKDLEVKDAIDELFKPLNIFKEEDQKPQYDMKDSDASNEKGMAKTKALPAFKNTKPDISSDAQSN